jgi:hypothetical protein
MTTAEFYNCARKASRIVAATCSGHCVLVSKSEALSWVIKSERGRVAYRPEENTLYIGLLYCDGEPIKDPQSSHAPSGQQPES